MFEYLLVYSPGPFEVGLMITAGLLAALTVLSSMKN